MTAAFYGLLFFTFACISPLDVSAQKIAFLYPDKSSGKTAIAEKLETALSEKFSILDDSLAETAARSFPDLNIFNLSTEEARNLGRAIGCDFFIATKTETLRRESLLKPAYYESYVVVYLVSSQTGRLVFWKLTNAEAQTPGETEKKLSASIGTLADEVTGNVRATKEKELTEASVSKFENLPDEESASKNFRPPLPYRRLKPAYTATANLYGVAATVDATVDLDETGNVLRVEITRWAGYGLDESVENTIRKMQWRAAERDGKTLPIRVLLRYNFKKLENEDIN